MESCERRGDAPEQDSAEIEGRRHSLYRNALRGQAQVERVPIRGARASQWEQLLHLDRLQVRRVEPSARSHKCTQSRKPPAEYAMRIA